MQAAYLINLRQAVHERRHRFQSAHSLALTMFRHSIQDLWQYKPLRTNRINSCARIIGLEAWYSRLRNQTRGIHCSDNTPHTQFRLGLRLPVSSKPFSHNSPQRKSLWRAHRHCWEEQARHPPAPLAACSLAAAVACTCSGTTCTSVFPTPTTSNCYIYTTLPTHNAGQAA